MVPNAGLTEFFLQSIVHCLHPLVLDWHSFEDTLPRSDNGEVDGGGLGDNLDYFCVQFENFFPNFLRKKNDKSDKFPKKFNNMFIGYLQFFPLPVK